MSDTSKGANTVVGLLDYFLTITDLVRHQSVSTLITAVGKNKNNSMIQYLLWHAMTGLHHSINLHFMIAGHI